MTESYEVTLEPFTGPLDLLLHLIQKQEINIYDIPIAEVTHQYVEYIRAMEELSLEIASEFIVMAATLLALKSRMLLPRKQIVVDEELVLEDPRDELVQQLLEYQRCKWAAHELKDREAKRALVFSRDPINLKPYAPTDASPVTGVTMWDLVGAFQKMLKRLPKENQVAEIRGSVDRVEDVMARLIERLSRLKTASFSLLMEYAATRSELVSAFLALLELVKNRVVVCTQHSAFDDIEIQYKGNGEEEQNVNADDWTS